jgi:hypothetical protein
MNTVAGIKLAQMCCEAACRAISMLSSSLDL